MLSEEKSSFSLSVGTTRKKSKLGKKGKFDQTLMQLTKRKEGVSPLNI